MNRPRILIEGIGGVGGVVAGELIRAGHRPALVTGNPRIAEAICAELYRRAIEGDVHP